MLEPPRESRGKMEDFSGSVWFNLDEDGSRFKMVEISILLRLRGYFRDLLMRNATAAPNCFCR